MQEGHIRKQHRAVLPLKALATSLHAICVDFHRDFLSLKFRLLSKVYILGYKLQVTFNCVTTTPQPNQMNYPHVFYQHLTDMPPRMGFFLSAHVVMLIILL